MENKLLSPKDKDLREAGRAGVWAHANCRKIMRKYNQRPRVVDKDQTGREETRLREHISLGVVRV